MVLIFLLCRLLLLNLSNWPISPNLLSKTNPVISLMLESFNCILKKLLNRTIWKQKSFNFFRSPIPRENWFYRRRANGKKRRHKTTQTFYLIWSNLFKKGTTALGSYSHWWLLSRHHWCEMESCHIFFVVRMPCWNVSQAEPSSAWELKLFLFYDHKYPHCTVTSFRETSSQPMCPSLLNSLCCSWPADLHSSWYQIGPSLWQYDRLPPLRSLSTVLSSPVCSHWPGRERTKDVWPS